MLRYVDILVHDQTRVDVGNAGVNGPDVHPLVLGGHGRADDPVAVDGERPTRVGIGTGALVVEERVRACGINFGNGKGSLAEVAVFSRTLTHCKLLLHADVLVEGQLPGEFNGLVKSHCDNLWSSCFAIPISQQDCEIAIFARAYFPKGEQKYVHLRVVHVLGRPIFPRFS